ncbi:hypothetical protein SISNIDRAFT_512735 [Sistotremastrum niveocremeum HHB9708]|uniref:Large ribosomal subunit protein uL30m n=1 Tax=Sistotremastrum niveocremeum HHB9708 TaxID=1314777 RepID=A0A164T1L7_9AGAM|nr:hypothetical protein SISNIDRAFT_512735 [Sistotremastrum niveocremeum HHB9708]
MTALTLLQSRPCFSRCTRATVSSTRASIRWLSTTQTQPADGPAQPSTSTPPSNDEPLTHYRITLRRSAIALDARMKGTLLSLGIHRRMQTVYHPHSPEFAGKILRVKELVEVENVPASKVRTKIEQKQERKAKRGYQVVGRHESQQW